MGKSNGKTCGVYHMFKQGGVNQMVKLGGKKLKVGLNQMLKSRCISYV